MKIENLIEYIENISSDDKKLQRVEEKASY